MNRGLSYEKGVVINISTSKEEEDNNIYIYLLKRSLLQIADWIINKNI